MKIVSFCIIAIATMAAIGMGVAHASPNDILSVITHSSAADLVSAMGIMLPLNARARGIVGARADTSNANLLLAELQKAVADFRSEHESEISGIKNKIDVVHTEKMGRIETYVSDLQSAMDDVNASLAALKIGGGGGSELDPVKAEYGRAFDKFFRKGVEAGLSDLAVKASLTRDSDPDGGYVVPDQMESTIDRIMTTVSAMRSISRVMNISTASYKKLINKGGATGGWVGEKESRPGTNTPQLSQLEFPAMELYANPAATQSLLDDSAVDIEAWLGDEVSIVFAEMEGAAFISGDGINKPRGLLSYNTVANASYAWGKLGFIATGVASDINDATHNGTDALLDLVYSLKQGYRQNARFLMNRTLQSKVRKLKTIGDTEAYLWQPSVQVGQPATLLGYPITDDDNMSDVGSNAFPIAFGDFSRGYLIVDRTGIRVLRDPFTNKPYVHFYTTKRVGGGVQNFEAIKLLKCA
ncbi:MAG: phage major capsid protein [Mesorhizobium sp.]